MKKLVSLLLAAVLVVGMAATPAKADDTVTVNVTIIDENGSVAIAQVPVEVSDADADGALTINDALFCAHELCFEGGAEAGYASYTGDYGLSLSKLWGVDNGGSYGYYVNNASAWSLADPVADGDYVNAFIYTDLVTWSDAYSYFDVECVDGEEGEEVTLTLFANGYDESWNVVSSPVEGAVIYFDGEATDVVTDAEGKAVVELPEGKIVISAKSDTMILVAPVCVAFGEAVPEAAEEAEDVLAAVPTLPQTGLTSSWVFFAGAAVLVLAGAALVKYSRRENN